jgi:hypothetical protein
MGKKHKKKSTKLIDLAVGALIDFLIGLLLLLLDKLIN